MLLRLTKRKAAKPIPLEGEVLHFTVPVALPYECQLVVAREAVVFLMETVRFPECGFATVTREDELANLNTAKMLRLTHRLFKAAVDAQVVKSFDLRHKREVTDDIKLYSELPIEKQIFIELPIMTVRSQFYHTFARYYNLASEWHNARQPHLCLAFREFLAWRIHSAELLK